MGTRSQLLGGARGRRPSRSTLLVALVVCVLATVPVLVPLLVTGGSPRSVPVAVPSVEGPLADRLPAPTRPAGPDRAGRAAGRTPPPAVPSAGSVAPAGTSATPGPAPASGGTAAGSPDARARPTTPTPTEPPAGSVSVLGALPDLVVLAVSWSPAEPRAGEPVTFTATVRNIGTSTTAARVPHNVAFSVDDTKVSWAAGDGTPLAPGQERAYTANGGVAGATWAAVAGEHPVVALVDDVGLIPETDDGNNAGTATVTVA